jgi:N,N'-diacetylchitobiose transport system permease protein
VILVGAAFVLPFSIWLLTGFFADALPKEVEEAASLDGAGGFTFLWRILVANAVPGIVATGIFAFMYGWNDYIFALTFLNDQAKWPIAIGASSSVGLFAVDWGKLMVASLVGTLPIMALFVAFRRPLESGLSGAR